MSRPPAVGSKPFPSVVTEGVVDKGLCASPGPSEGPRVTNKRPMTTTPARGGAAPTSIARRHPRSAPLPPQPAEFETWRHSAGPLPCGLGDQSVAHAAPFWSAPSQPVQTGRERNAAAPRGHNGFRQVQLQPTQTNAISPGQQGSSTFSADNARRGGTSHKVPPLRLSCTGAVIRR